MKSAPIANFEDQSERWSLSWKPDDRCGRFTREAILALAPPASGIYGLFNHDCQIFIGESDDIQEVLLRLERETDFQSDSLRPTGFTFELCPEETRKQKASALVARYRPALQVIAAGAPRGESIEKTAKTTFAAEEDRAESHQFPEREAKVSPAFQWKRAHFTSAILLFGAAATAYYFDIAHVKSGSPDAASHASVAQQEVSAATRTALSPQPAAAASGHRVPQRAAADIPLKTSGGLRGAAASGGEGSEVRKISAPPRSDERSEKSWSVQIASMPQRSLADSLAQELIEKGHDAYVVKAEVKGQTYYRVRAGRFDTRQNAESMRHALSQQQTYRTSYVTND